MHTSITTWQIRIISEEYGTLRTKDLDSSGFRGIKMDFFFAEFVRPDSDTLVNERSRQWIEAATNPT